MSADQHVADVLRDVWDSYRDDREGFVDCLLDPDRSGLRVTCDQSQRTPHSSGGVS